MTLLDRFRTRSVSYQDVWGSGASWDGGLSDPQTRELSIVSTLACIDLKASSIGAMPLQEFIRSADGTTSRTQLEEILDDPSDVFSPDEWVYAAVASLSLWQEAVGLVTATAANRWPRKIEWLVPSSVTMRKEHGIVVYRLADNQPHTAIGQGGDILHIRRMPLPGAVGGGMSISQATRDLVNVGIEGAKSLVAASISGGLPIAHLEWDGELETTQAEATAERYESLRRAHPNRPFTTGRGWKLTPIPRGDIATSAADIRRQVHSEIAVAHGVPPELVGGSSGGSMTYSTLEGLTRHLEVRALLPIYRPLERALSRNLIPSPRYVKFNADAVVRTTLVERYRANDIGIRAGFLSPDEARSREELSPIPDGAGDRFVWPDNGTATDPTRDLVEMVQKLYLGVGTVLTADEARKILNDGGADLAIPGPFGEPQ